MTALLIKVTAALAVSLFGARLLRRGRAAVRHALLAGGFGVLIALPVAATIAPKVAVPIPIDLSMATREVMAVPKVEHHAESVITDGTMTAAGPDDRRRSRVSFGTLLIFVWIAGAVALLMPVFAGLVEVRRIRRQARPEPALERMARAASRGAGLSRRFEVLTHDGVVGPMTFGIRRPVVILPASAVQWAEDDVNRALLHELEHVRRGDWLTHCVARAVCAAYWFHPMAWMAWRELVFEAERACDDAVVTGADAERYADQLLSLAQRLSARRQPHLAMADRRDLSRRVLAVLNETQLRGRAGRPCLAGVVAAAVILTGLLTPLQWVARAATPAPVPLLQIQDPPRQSFEVASVKPNKSAGGGGFIRRMRAGTFSAGNQTLLQLIRFAYGIQAYQLVGAPDWIRTERFDITAKAAADTPSTVAGGPSEAVLLRSLLEDRFRMSVHRETRDVPIYALVVARADGQLGPRLRRPSSDYCARRAEAAAKPGAPAPPEGGPVCGLKGSSNELTGGSFPMAGFATFLAGQAERVVVDRTGLTGGWDFDLKWSPSDTANPDPDRPVIFTALQEQLGLRLEATTGPVEVLVIDRLEQLIPD